jgi:hypothetical protein
MQPVGRQDARDHRQRRASPGRRARARPGRGARGGARVGALASRDGAASRAHRLRRGLRLPSAAPALTPDQAPTRRANEAGEGVRCGLRPRDAEPDGPRLPRPENAGTWMLGRLQTDADRARVIEGLGEKKKGPIDTKLVQRVARAGSWSAPPAPTTSRCMQPRWAMSLLRGPMTVHELQQCSALSRVGRRSP